ncbi:DUF445 domain-containing protein [Streptomyces sp. PTM05]|uniref:DUF445 domain-containing protein n=1 Tax=Streptantibioticus parmotrematis TaxID=2873249 RepID=A0ABS7QXM2_9ACTN|nr:DUF445 domain-containing protein [Streptantibioticus parmotrematis]MBY8887948.1 DUF445 domain-containing protein [Streptantibioticus parmotrematis]
MDVVREKRDGATGSEAADGTGGAAGSGGAGAGGAGALDETDAPRATDAAGAAVGGAGAPGAACEVAGTGGARLGGGGGFAFGPADEERRRGVRRMKLIATGFLLVATVVYGLAKWAGASGAGAWTGYVAAAAEAGMVGALADWFAVTALFKRPLGLPIPHTAIIPTKKDVLGRSLGEFVGENFLSEPVVRARLRAVGIGRRLGHWLADPEHADRVMEQAAAALRGALTVLRDSDVQAVVGEAITRRADAMEVAPGLGRMLERVVTDGGHRRVVDLVCARGYDWLVTHGDSVMAAVQGGAPGWTPRFVDRRVGERVYKELVRFVSEMRDMPEHPARAALDRFLGDFAGELQSDQDTRERVERLKRDVLARGEVQDLIESTWNAVRSMVVAAAEDDHSELRLRARASLLSLGTRMASDERLQAKVDGWLEDAATYVVTTYRDEITLLITDTVASWDADQTSRKIEAHVGRDLQFIRINGTVVGALAGLVIYTVSRLVGG